ncbi:MAG: quinolinate synthase NadA [Planctomycetota bacterium]|jgi:quinolinate synthase
MATETLAGKVRDLAKARGALILAHNYQLGEVQDVADFVGDSLGLARKAAETRSGLIVFCGVHFMAETAKILNPDATVLEPDPRAGCPLADMLTVESLRKLKSDRPDALVVTYVNSTAEVKAESDYCCTSGNAVSVINALPSDKEIIFVPDASLGEYVSQKTGRKLILWQGYCPTHHRITAAAVEEVRRKHPAAKVVVHPECTPDVTALADEVTSTSGIIAYAGKTPFEEYIVGTENGMLHRLAKEFPEKKFYHVTGLAICPNMKLNTLEKVLWALEETRHEVTLPEETSRRARRAVERMVEIA